VPEIPVTAFADEGGCCMEQAAFATNLRGGERDNSSPGDSQWSHDGEIRKIVIRFCGGSRNFTTLINNLNKRYIGLIKLLYCSKSRKFTLFRHRLYISSLGMALPTF
jgi:hypothetical protein